MAGFDTVSTLLSFMAHELAINPFIQDTLYKEIYSVEKQLDGAPLTYEVIQRMRYLDMVISETLRKWPPVGVLDRISNKPIVLNNKGRAVHIDAGQGFMIPVYAIHRDEKYYPNAEQFDPERFNEENSKTIKTGTYMPFGLGPRVCIGSRFALLECKSIFYHMLLKYRFEKCEKTQDPLRLGKGITAIAEKGFWLQVTWRLPDIEKV